MRTRLDAFSSAFFERQLVDFEARLYDIKYPEHKAKMYIPVKNDLDPGAVSYGYRQIEKLGRAKIIGADSTDLPRVDVSGAEYFKPFRVVGDYYDYSIDEIAAAAKAGFALDFERASSARRAIESEIDEIAALGAPDFGIADGFLNNSSVTISGATGKIAAMTADQILNDFGAMLGAIASDTLDTSRADTLLLPTTQYMLLASKQLPNTNTTLLEFLRTKLDGITYIGSWHKLAGAGAGAVDRGVMYQRNPEVLQLLISREFTQEPPQPTGLKYEIPCHAKTAGCVIRYPKAIRYIDGI